MLRITSIILTLFLLFTLTVVQESSAQNVPDEGTWGISSSIQANQANLIVPYRLRSNISVAPLIGFESFEDQVTRFRVGVKPQFYQEIGSDFASYIGGLLLMRFVSPANQDTDSSFLLGVSGGGEYYLSQHFSVGVEGQLNLVIDNQNSIGTGAAVTATYYF